MTIVMKAGAEQLSASSRQIPAIGQGTQTVHWGKWTYILVHV